MNKLPTSVVVIGWLFIVAGTIGLIYHGSELKNRAAFHHELLWVCAIRLLAIVGGVFLLRGCGWARWVLAGWMGYHLILSAFHSVGEFLMHAALFGVIGYFLLRPRTSACFRNKPRV